MARQTKTLEYRRARFLDDGQNLEALVRQAWGQFGTQAERTITFSDDRSSCGLRARDCNANGFAVHCGRYTDGQGVGTIPTVPAPEVEVGERPPEPGENFLNSDLMALISGNHVICMNCGRNAGSLRIYLQQLFRKAGMPDESRQFELVRIGSPDKLAIIEAVGVKSIDLEVDISEATAFEVVEGDGGGGIWQSIKQNFGNALAAVTARDESVEQLRTAERGTMKVSINVPKGDLDAAKHGLDDFAEEVVEDEESDAFTIHLRDGRTTIKPNEVSVRKQVKLETAANSVSVFQAWDAMETYMGELNENGQIEA
ncbi:hypothetical protein Jann_2893 [Jannaschia sp. CCS1]|nr:hypothetical protein Jann_2893 [Jannaschia sp. CCS1]